MRTPSPSRLASRLVLAGVFALVAHGVASLRATEPEERLERLTAHAGQQAPVVRIGLEPAHRVILSSEGAFRVLDLATGEAAWRDRYRGELAVVAEGGPDGEVPRVFRIQVAAFREESVAQAERARLAATFGEPAVVRFVPDRGSWRVRVGEARERFELEPLLGRLRAAGLEGAWIAEEPAESPGVSLRLVDADYESRPTGMRRLVAVPDGDTPLKVNEKPYRGIVELRVDGSGRVRPISWLNLEAYLRGVVPAEMGPEVWPQIEALKAQAVAARTYAWRNLGQFDEEGFDICASPRCQVYGGIAVEHPMTDRAVAETRGEIVTFEGRAIRALYTATCGGHTEDAGLVFPEEKAPYLKGVPCRAEAQEPSALPLTVSGRVGPTLRDETGADVSRDEALLVAAGVYSPDGPTDVRAWIRALSRRSGRPPSVEDGGAPATTAEALALVVQGTGWGERAQLLLSESDVPALLRDPASASLPGAQRRSLAYLVSVGALRPGPEGSFGLEAPPSRARLAPVLARIGESYDAFRLEEAVFAGGEGRHLRLVQGRRERRVRLAEEPFVIGWAGAIGTRVAKLDLWAGDRVRFRTDDSGRIDFLELRPPVKGTSDDRAAQVYSWEVRRTREELENTVDRRLAVGHLKRLSVLRRGVSGRAVEIKVVGEDGEAVVAGFDIRGLLDLRETPTIVEPQHDDGGRLEAVVFAGKGWGHGVGLCQVGAYGMALRGRHYREILSHYYPGTSLDRSAVEAR